MACFGCGSEIDLVVCDTTGEMLCHDCHLECAHGACARENDPTDGYDRWFDETLTW